jgi:uncharacterized phiE125 gp8 family phage protein
MPLAANALVDLATAKDHLSIPSADTTRDARVTRLINAASALIERYTRRKLVTGNYTDVLDGSRQNRIMTRQWPVTAVSSLKVASDGDFASVDPLDTTTYFTDSDGITVCLRSGMFPRGNGNVEVQYTAGLGTLGGGTIPADLQHACLETVLWFYAANSSERIGVLQKGKGGETTQYVEDLPAHIRSMLDPYVRSEFYVGGVAIDNG